MMKKERKKSKKGKRRRKVIWFNPPYSRAVETNIGKEFLKILKECFPKGNKMHKIFNTNNVKLSYSCLPSMEKRITALNSKKISKSTNISVNNNTAPEECRCRVDCPLSGDCKTRNIVYCASVKVENENIEKKYYGLTSVEFILRYRNHKFSFNNKKYSKSTELSKFIWELKERNIN